MCYKRNKKKGKADKDRACASEMVNWRYIALLLVWTIYGLKSIPSPHTHRRARKSLIVKCTKKTIESLLFDQTVSTERGKRHAHTREKRTRLKWNIWCGRKFFFIRKKVQTYTKITEFERWWWRRRRKRMKKINIILHAISVQDKWP